MEYTTHYTLPSLERPFGPDDTSPLRLRSPAALQIDFVYEPGEAARSHDANGDPGDPGSPEIFDFKRVLARQALELSSDCGLFVLQVAAGADLYERLREHELEAIEADLVTQRRLEAALEVAA